MQSDWSVECGAEDPVVVVPWSNKDGSVRYVDLQQKPEAVRDILETVEYPVLAAALLRWNQWDSPLFTAKCDVWNYPARLFDGEDLPGFAHAHGSYIDLIAAQPGIFSSFAASENLLQTWSTAAGQLSLECVRCEWTLRRAHILPVAAKSLGSIPEVGAVDGFATTFYVWGYGSSPQVAQEVWAAALTTLIEPVQISAALKIG